MTETLTQKELSNRILLDKEGSAYLSDFGIAKEILGSGNRDRLELSLQHGGTDGAEVPVEAGAPDLISTEDGGVTGSPSNAAALR